MPGVDRVKANRHIGMSVRTICMSEPSLFFLCAGRAKPSHAVFGMLMPDKEEVRLSRAMVKAHVLSLQSRGRGRATSSMGRGHLARVTSLHAADRSSTGEQCTGVDRWDAPRRGDGSGQRTGHGYSAASEIDLV